MTDTIYNVPPAFLDQYRAQPVILRSASIAELSRAVPALAPDAIVFLQLVTPPPDPQPRIHGAEGIPIELWIENPATEYPGLYHYAPLLDDHPVRVSLPALPGVGRALKLALSLQFAVQIRLLQPATEVIQELVQSLEMFLHDATVSRPVDVFHDLFFAFLNRDPVPLWVLLEEDPQQFRRISDCGKETYGGKLSDWPDEPEPGFCSQALTRALAANNAECSECPYLAHCGAYFKWPSANYDCSGVKTLFQTIEQAANEFAADLERYPAKKKESRA